MSFARYALRHTAVQALMGATKFGENVFNSDFEAFDISSDGSVRTSKDRPFILIYTDDSVFSDTDRIDLWQNGVVDFVIEFGIAQAMTETDPDTAESNIIGFSIPPTDAAMEVALDVVGRQIATALQGASQWAELWRSMASGMAKLEHQRATLNDNGTRMAARQIRIALNVLTDPVYQAPLADGSVWKRFETAVAGTDAEEITAMMLGTLNTELSFEDIRARYGLSNAASDALSQTVLTDIGDTIAGSDTVHNG